VGSRLTIRFFRADDFAEVSAELLTNVQARLTAPPIATNIDDLADGPTVEFEIVGIDARPTEFPPLQANLSPPLHVTEAFYDAYGEDLVTSPVSYIQLREGQDDLPAFKLGVEQLAQGEPVSFISSLVAQQERIERALNVEAWAEAVVVFALGLTLAVVAAQALARQVRAVATTHPVARALGVTPSGLFLVGLAPAVVAGVVAAIVAVPVAALVTPYALVGLARIMLGTDIGLDPTIAVAGALGVMVVLPLLAAIPSLRAARDAGIVARRGGMARLRLSRQAWRGAWVRSLRLPPATGLGTRLAFTSGGGSEPTAIASTVLSVAVAVAVLAATATFGASLRQLVDTPSDYGWTWDVTVGTPALPDIGQEFGDAFAADSAVSDVAMGTILQADLAGSPRRVDILALDQRKGEVHPSIVDGRAPETPEEVALGMTTLRDADVEIGDQVTVRIESVATRLEVVGTALFPQIGDEAQIGRGALVTFETLADLLPSARRNTFYVRFEPDYDSAVQAERVRAALTPVPVRTAVRPSDLADLVRVRGLPVVLAVILTALAAATLAHMLVSSVRARRRLIGEVKALGFERRQVLRAVRIQAAILGVTAFVIGLPVGVAFGRLAWRLDAQRIGVVAPPETPWAVLVALAVGVVLVATFAAVVPARMAAHTQTALALRDE
jgi:ABC-type lipoprotein release transport system permease subunit